MNIRKCTECREYRYLSADGVCRYCDSSTVAVVSENDVLQSTVATVETAVRMSSEFRCDDRDHADIVFTIERDNVYLQVDGESIRVDDIHLRTANDEQVIETVHTQLHQLKEYTDSS